MCRNFNPGRFGKKKHGASCFGGNLGRAVVRGQALSPVSGSVEHFWTAHGPARRKRLVEIKPWRGVCLAGEEGEASRVPFGQTPVVSWGRTLSRAKLVFQKGKQNGGAPGSPRKRRSEATTGAVKRSRSAGSSRRNKGGAAPGEPQKEELQRVKTGLAP